MNRWNGEEKKDADKKKLQEIRGEKKGKLSATVRGLHIATTGVVTAEYATECNITQSEPNILHPGDSEMMPRSYCTAWTGIQYILQCPPPV